MTKIEEPENGLSIDPLLHHRQITLADGRYMIFYTFGDDETTKNAEVTAEQRDV